MTAANGDRSVLHLLPIMSAGGAEYQLCRLAEDQAAAGLEVTVGCLRATPEFRRRLDAGGVRVVSRSTGTAAFMRSIREAARRASVTHAWMYHGFVMSIVIRPWTSGPHVWAVRRTRPDSPGLRRRTRLIILLTRTLSRRFADGIVYCSQAAQVAHEQFGFEARRSTAVVYNSVDGHEADGRSVHRTAPTRIGLLGRWNHDKGIDVLLDAWARVAEHHPDVTLELAGGRLTRDNPDLVSQIAELGVFTSVTLTGPVDDPAGFVASLDCLVSPSRTEGFPNVVAEAMSLGVPVIATRVGGTPEVLGRCGALIESEQPEQLAQAIMSFIVEPATLRAAAAEGPARVAAEFSRARSRDETAAFYRHLDVD